MAAERGPDPAQPAEPRGGPPPGGEPDPLEALGERLRAAQESAERLVREANRSAEQAAAESERQAGRRPPPRGYATTDGADGARTGLESQALLALLELGRGLVPAELRAQLAELVRELLLLVRALIDWYLERTDARRREPVEVEDIPIT